MMCLGVNKCHGKNENGKGRGLTRRPTLDWGLKEYDAGAEESLVGRARIKHSRQSE